MVIVRLLPLAPFTLTNLVAGASGIRIRDFTLGTALGMAPGILAITVFEAQLEDAIRNPGIATLLTVAGLVLVIAIAAALARRWLTKEGGHLPLQAPRSGKAGE
jgi:uncharacterized membrane protein YdjX (TVP38/TMEM64 family)